MNLKSAFTPIPSFSANHWKVFVPGHGFASDKTRKTILLSTEPHPFDPPAELATDVMSNVSPSHTTTKFANPEASGAPLS